MAPPCEREGEEEEEAYAGVLEALGEEVDEEHDGEEDDDLARDATEGEDGQEEEEEEGEEEEGEVASGEGDEVEIIESDEPSLPLAKVPRPSKHKRQRKLVSLLLSKYDSVWEAAENMGWQTFGADQDEGPGGKYSVCWSDTSVSLERVMRMGRLQKINHFPVRAKADMMPSCAPRAFIEPAGGIDPAYALRAFEPAVLPGDARARAQDGDGAKFEQDAQGDWKGVQILSEDVHAPRRLHGAQGGVGQRQKPRQQDLYCQAF